MKYIQSFATLYAWEIMSPIPLTLGIRLTFFKRTEIQNLFNVNYRLNNIFAQTFLDEISIWKRRQIRFIRKHVADNLENIKMSTSLQYSL